MARDTFEKARAIPFTLAAGASAYFDCDSDSLYVSEGPTTPGELYFQLDDDGPELTFAQGAYARLWRFRRLRLRNASALAFSGVLMLSHDPDFFVMQPGGGSGGGGTLSDVAEGLGLVSARFYPFSVLLPAAGSGGSTSVLRHPVGELDTGAVFAASKFRQTVEEFNGRQMWTDGATAFWGRRQRVRARVLVYTSTNGGDDDSIAAVQLGLAAAHPLALQTIVRLSLVLNAAAAYFFRLTVSNGVASTSADLTGVAVPALNRGYLLEIDFRPGQDVRAYVDGVLGATIATSLPTGSQNRGAGVFVGEDASSVDRTAAAFSNLEAYTYAP